MRRKGLTTIPRPLSTQIPYTCSLTSPLFEVSNLGLVPNKYSEVGSVNLGWGLCASDMDSASPAPERGS
jgi:hypothetical protein